MSEHLRELDAQVAEKVMGVIWDHTRCRVCGWPLADRSENGCTKKSCSLRPAPDRRADLPAPYSSNISAAMGVLGRFNDGPWGITRSDHPSAKDTPYSVFIARHEKGHSSRLNHVDAEAATLPEAICKAALKAAVETEE